MTFRVNTGRQGTAMIVVIGIVALLLIYASGNVRTLDHLGRELRLLEQSQRRAWVEVELDTSTTSVRPGRSVPSDDF